MKKSILTLGLLAFIGLTAVSCSTDDSVMETSGYDSPNTGGVKPLPTFDNGDKDLPKPPQKP